MIRADDIMENGKKEITLTESQKKLPDILKRINFWTFRGDYKWFEVSSFCFFHFPKKKARFLRYVKSTG